MAAASYDGKWGIDFGETGQGQVLGKVRKLLGPGVASRFDSALEIGAGTGYFSLNMMSAGLIDELTCTDISSGMLEVLHANAQRLELEQRERARRDAESLPFGDESFDLVLGPCGAASPTGPGPAFTEFHRVLRPGGADPLRR